MLTMLLRYPICYNHISTIAHNIYFAFFKSIIVALPFLIFRIFFSDTLKCYHFIKQFEKMLDFGLLPLPPKHVVQSPLSSLPQGPHHITDFLKFHPVQHRPRYRLSFSLGMSISKRLDLGSLKFWSILPLGYYSIRLFPYSKMFILFIKTH